MLYYFIENFVRPTFYRVCSRLYLYIPTVMCVDMSFIGCNIVEQGLYIYEVGGRRKKVEWEENSIEETQPTLNTLRKVYLRI